MLTYASTASTKWATLPTVFHSGTIAEIAPHVPRIERHATANPQRDVIVSAGDDPWEVVPLAMVSRGYALLPHRDVLDALVAALESADISPDDVTAELCVSEHGERMALSAILPEHDNFDPGDGHPMALRFECLNSVDRSTGFRALLGWYRLVCCNGMIIGTTQHDVRARHVGTVNVEYIEDVLAIGLEAAGDERSHFERWLHTNLDTKPLREWADGPLRAAWGFKAAARAWHIINEGCDAAVAGSFKRATPTTIATTALDRVPGAPDTARNLFDVSQALAWLARQRKDLLEQLKWREQIPDLIAQL